MPPRCLNVPLIPESIDGKFMFHNNPMYNKVSTSIELKRALDLGYKITKIHSALEYHKHKGLMKGYVEKFIKLKISCSKK